MADLICHLRNTAVKSGDIPERLRKSSVQMVKDLKMSPMIGRTIAQREELGLSTEEMSSEDRETVRKMIRGAGYDV